MKVDLLDLRDRAKGEEERECVTEAAHECFSRCATVLGERLNGRAVGGLLDELDSLLQELRTRLPKAVTAGLSDEQLAACLVHTAYCVLLPRPLTA